jgi:rhodanese-related sulfurtransferase
MFAGKRMVFFEAIVVLILGFGFALAANRLSPRGLSLTRDYFARGTTTTKQAPTGSSPSPSGAISNAAAPLANSGSPGFISGENQELKQRLEAKGLSLIEGGEVEKLFRDPQYNQELIVFIDARNDHHYEEGHIPGAYQLDHYYPEKYLGNVIPACQNAARIVVYCTGGKCEDSEFAALMLVDAGVPAQKISVYAGGITDWTAQKRPVEIGARRSGNIK